MYCTKRTNASFSVCFLPSSFLDLRTPAESQWKNVAGNEHRVYGSTLRWLASERYDRESVSSITRQEAERTRIRRLEWIQD
jgi:hypothetical protein